MPLENPRQTAAFDYAAPLQSQESEVFPGDGLSCGDVCHDLHFRHGEHHPRGDAARGRRGGQTRETLDNIAALISEENLCRHGLPGLGTSLDGLGLVRVYIKRQDDYAVIRDVCQPRLGELPTIYAVADVCRPELLVEIEGIAFCAVAIEPCARRARAALRPGAADALTRVTRSSARASPGRRLTASGSLSCGKTWAMSCPGLNPLRWNSSGRIRFWP